MKGLLFISVLSLLIIASPALAMNVSVSVDKNKVFMGDTVTLSGKITNDDGTTGIFQYRAAVVAPKRIIVCDSNTTATASDGTFSLSCKLPTVDQANALGIPAALTREVIPYVGGVAVKNITTNETIKKHTRAIIAVNQDKFTKTLDDISARIDEFKNHSQKFIPECDKIAEKAAQFNISNVTIKCLQIQQKINNLITNATALSAQAQQLKSSLNSTDIETFRDSLKTLRDSMKDLREQLKDIKDTIKSVRWEKLKEIKKDREQIRKEIEQKRMEIKQLRNESRELRNETRGLR